MGSFLAESHHETECARIFMLVSELDCFCNRLPLPQIVLFTKVDDRRPHEIILRHVLVEDGNFQLLAWAVYF